MNAAELLRKRLVYLALNEDESAFKRLLKSYPLAALPARPKPSPCETRLATED